MYTGIECISGYLLLPCNLWESVYVTKREILDLAEIKYEETSYLLTINLPRLAIYLHILNSSTYLYAINMTKCTVIIRAFCLDK